MDLKNIILQSYNNTYNLIGGIKDDNTSKIYAELDKINLCEENWNFTNTECLCNKCGYKFNIYHQNMNLDEKIRLKKLLHQELFCLKVI